MFLPEDVWSHISYFVDNADWINWISTCKTIKSFNTKNEIKRRQKMINHLMKLIKLFPKKEWCIEKLGDNPKFYPLEILSPEIELEYTFNNPNISINDIKNLDDSIFDNLCFFLLYNNPNLTFDEIYGAKLQGMNIYEDEYVATSLTLEQARDLVLKGYFKTIDKEIKIDEIYTCGLLQNRFIVNDEDILAYLYQEYKYVCWSYITAKTDFKIIEKHPEYPWDLHYIFYNKSVPSDHLRKIINKNLDPFTLEQYIKAASYIDDGDLYEVNYSMIDLDSQNEFYSSVIDNLCCYLNLNYVNEDIRYECFQCLDAQSEQHLRSHMRNPKIDLHELLPILVELGQLDNSMPISDLPNHIKEYFNKYNVKLTEDLFRKHALLSTNPNLTWDLIYKYKDSNIWDFYYLSQNTFDPEIMIITQVYETD